jgi:hypothetical protein
MVKGSWPAWKHSDNCVADNPTENSAVYLHDSRDELRENEVSHGFVGTEAADETEVTDLNSTLHMRRAAPEKRTTLETLAQKREKRPQGETHQA